MSSLFASTSSAERHLHALARNIDYLGWAGKQDQDNYDDCNIVSVKFVWDDDDPDKEVKPMVCG